MEDKQLLPEGEIFEDEILAGTEDADQPTQEMPEPYTHGENHIEQLPVEPVAKSLDLRMHDVLRTHRPARFASGRKARPSSVGRLQV